MDNELQNIKETFSERLRHIRKSKKITQQELADKLEIDIKSVSRWENGSVPTIELAVSLSKALDVSLNELLGIEDNNSVTEKKNRVSKSRSRVAPSTPVPEYVETPEEKFYKMFGIFP